MNEDIIELLTEHNFKIVDCHTHMGPYVSFHIPTYDKNAMIKMMNLINIHSIASSAHLGITSDSILGNDYIIDAANSFDKRIFIYATVNPNYPQEIEPELHRVFSHKNTVGIKIHCDLHNCPINDQRYEKVFSFAHEQKTNVLMHVWGIEAVKQAYSVSKKYANAKFILGHSGAEHNAMKLALEMANECENIYLDTAISMAYEDNIEWFVKKTKINKILFGSDMPFYDPRMNLGRILLSKLTNNEKKYILGENFNFITEGKVYG